MTRFSLHRTRKPQECDICGTVIPARKHPDYAEYWRAKGGERGSPKIICCVCHVIFGFPEDGWMHSPDGIEVMAAAVPQGEKSFPQSLAPERQKRQATPIP